MKIQIATASAILALAGNMFPSTIEAHEIQRIHETLLAEVEEGDRFPSHDAKVAATALHLFTPK